MNVKAEVETPIHAIARLCPNSILYKDLNTPCQTIPNKVNATSLCVVR